MGQRCLYFNYDSNIVIIHLIVLVIFMSMITGHQTKSTIPEIDYVTANHHIIKIWKLELHLYLHFIVAYSF